MKSTLLLLLLLLAGCGGGGSDEPVHVFIFAGQSNMAGSDATITADMVHDLADAGMQTDVDRTALFTFQGGASSYPWGDIRGHEGVSLGRNYLTPDTTHHVKVHGPEVGFNRAMGGNIAIIKYADNYTSLEGGRSAWVAPGTRWTAWQAFVDKQLAALGRPYVIEGFVWFQGIDDGLLARDHDSYKADLEKIAADLRAKYGNHPLILGQSVNSPIAGSAAMAPIRWAQVEVGGESGNALITVDDLGPYVNSHHLCESSQVIAGQRFAAAYATISGVTVFRATSP